MKRFLFAAVVVLMGCSNGKKDMDYPESYNFQRGREALENNEFDDAMTYMQKELQDDPKNGYAWTWVMFIHKEKEKYGEALSAGAKALKYLPKKDVGYAAFAHSMTAQVYNAMEEREKALEEITMAIKLQPEDVDYLSMRGGWYYRMENYEKSDADYKKIVKLEPGSIDGYMGLGRNLLVQKRYDEAAEKFSYVMKLDDDYSQAYGFRASCHMGKGDNHAAAADIVKALDMDGNDRAFAIMQDVNDTCYRELIVMMKVKAAADAERAEWMYYMGVVHQQKNRFRKAIECFKECLAAEDFPAVYENISDCYSKIGDYPMAMKYIELSIKADTADTDLLRKCANICYYNGERAKAIDVMGKYVDANPESYYAYYRRGFFRDNAHDINGAIEDYSNAIVLNPNYAYSYLGRGDMYMLRGDSAKARIDYEKVVQLDTIIGESGNCRQYGYLMLGQQDSAEVYMKKILVKYPTSGNYYDAACLMSRMGNTERAIGYLKNALEEGYCEIAHMELDDDLKEVRETEEYKTIVAEYQRRIEERNNEMRESEIVVEEAEKETTEIPFKKDGDMMTVQCTINGLPLHFIFDTGASDVSISDVEANFMLKNGYLSKNDIVGKSNYGTADGSVHEGLVLNLKNVNISGLDLKNVRASVVKNQKAPLLLGQSVFGRLGKIEIDNAEKVIKVTHVKH